ncbi:MAG TPA: hypothetical protein VM305_01940 [Candidatus Limnocylindrales bacterium]|nr:hypothetical protein [Candidatus Limnocylindrales bacterium]
MPAQNEPPKTPESEPPKAPESDPPKPPATDPAEPPVGEKTYSQAELDAALADVRREAAKWRTEHRKAADALEAAAKQQMTEEEKRAADVAKKERELAERETAAQERLLAAAIREAAAAAGVAPARLALIPRLIDRTEVQFEDAREPTNVPALIKSLLEAYPEFRAAAGGSGSADGGSRGKSSLTREQIEKMTPAEINSRWVEIQEFLARGARA